MADNGIAERVPFGVGAAAGAGAWVLGYLVTYLVASSDIQNSLFGQVLEAAEIGTWQVVGWVFYNAHFVNTNVDLGFFGSGATNAIGGDGGFTVLLYVVPPLLLLGAGLAVGRAAGAGSLDAANAAVAGASTVIGYGLLSVVGVFLFATESVTPDLVTGILLGGLLYPVVFGAVGGFVAKATEGGA
ncbi:hypothetical protein [Halosegnis marinus]|uniref:Transporter n=1 Tax=Halosegnis marinus TaxID=3034023 RepID=A0ABD5ZK04_9EURY|nr:hypothetical protein [Halosegnis sp. DT85]